MRMTGKNVKVQGIAKSIFADNIRRLMDERYSLSSNKPKSLAVDAGVTLSTIQRVLSEENAPTLDTVEAISGAFGLSPYQLLVAKLDVKRPQVVRPQATTTKKAKRLPVMAKAA